MGYPIKLKTNRLVSQYHWCWSAPVRTGHSERALCPREINHLLWDLDVSLHRISGDFSCMCQGLSPHPTFSQPVLSCSLVFSQITSFSFFHLCNLTNSRHILLFVSLILHWYTLQLQPSDKIWDQNILNATRKPFLTKLIILQFPPTFIFHMEHRSYLVLYKNTVRFICLFPGDSSKVSTQIKNKNQIFFFKIHSCTIKAI